MRLALVLLVLTLGCHGCHPSPAPLTPTAGDGAPGSYPATCDGLCALEASLGCPAAQPTPAGASCAVVCANQASAGIAPWDLGCRVRQTSCADIDSKCQ
jgi:hypothetical protein